MSPHPYTEDQLVEQPAIALLAELGWTTVNALDEVLGLDGTFGRETKSDVVLAAHLRAALVRLNPDVPAEAITAAIDQLVENRSALSLVAANREVYLLLKEGVPVSVREREPERGGQRTLRVRVIDWENTSNNDFLFVSQFSITGSLYTCRPDLVGFVNGLPLIVIELKKPGVPAKQAFDENLTSYKRLTPNGASVGTDAGRRGSFGNVDMAEQGPERIAANSPTLGRAVRMGPAQGGDERQRPRRRVRRSPDGVRRSARDHDARPRPFSG